MKHDKFNKKDILQKIMPVIENVAIKNGLIPIEVSFVKESERWFLRIFIYSNDHAVTHQDCENMTRGLGDYLDEIIPINYYLEVSSPGAERKLKSLQEYEIFKGKNIKLKLKKPLKEGEKKILYGKIIDYQKNIGLKLQEKETNQEILIEENNISSAKLCLEK